MAAVLVPVSIALRFVILAVLFYFLRRPSLALRRTPGGSRFPYSVNPNASRVLKMNRVVAYRLLGWVLVILGILWNLVGSLYGSVARTFPLGFAAFIIGIFYLLRARRLHSINLEKRDPKP